MVYINNATEEQKTTGIIIDGYQYTYQYQTYVESEDGVITWFDIFMDSDEAANGID